MKIRARTFAHLDGKRWEVDLGRVNGRRVRRFFRSRAEAKEWADEQADRRELHGTAALELTEADRILFASARDRLARAGASIGDAVAFYLAHHRPLREEVSMRELLDRCVADKELSGASARYLVQFASSCRRFIEGAVAGSVPAAEITRDRVKEWLLGAGLAPKTQRTYLGDLRTLFAWAEAERYVPKNVLDGKAGRIPIAREPDREVEILTVPECGRLLAAALRPEYRPLIGYVAACLFCGVRPDEARRTTAADIDLAGRVLIITGARAKTRQRRVIEMPRAAVAWARVWRRLHPGASRLAPANFDRLWRGLREKAGLARWPHDAMRHTFASYHYAAEQNLARLQVILGHSAGENTLFRHYRAARTADGSMVTAGMAREFWALLPRRVRADYSGATTTGHPSTSTGSQRVSQ